MNIHYLWRGILPCMLALFLAACATRPSPSASHAETLASQLAPLPEAVTSFAAATHEGWLYVCGGHKGERHDYNVDKVSGAFHRLRLSDGRAWEILEPTVPAQGAPLVAAGRYVYRIGGMAARNPAGTKQDLYSLTNVVRFDPRKRIWEDFTPLPEARSSHDAVVLGNRLYVGGGWNLSGTTRKAEWPDTLLVLDLGHPERGWKEIPQPFQRRALAMGVAGTRIYFIGGMTSDNNTSLEVDVYDTANGQWSQGPELPSGRFKGFSCSAIAQAGRLYANAFQGDLLRLSLDGKSWEVVGRLDHPRMAHRLVTAGSSQLIALGGEDGEEKRPDLELLTPAATPVIKTVQR